MELFSKINEIITLARDVLKAANQTAWGGKEEAKKVSEIIKTSLTGIDIGIGGSFALDDFACQDNVCLALDLIGCTSSTAGLVLGNIPGTAKFTKITSSITIVCRGIRLYCKHYGTVWGCTVAAGQAIKAGTTYICTTLPGKTPEEGMKCVKLVK